MACPAQVASPKARTPTARAKIPGPLAGLDPVAVEAVEAVDAAAKKLPPEEALKLSFMSETSYAARAPDEPPNAGTKVRIFQQLLGSGRHAGSPALGLQRMRWSGLLRITDQPAYPVLDLESHLPNAPPSRPSPRATRTA